MRRLERFREKNDRIIMAKIVLDNQLMKLRIAFAAEILLGCAYGP